MMQIPIIKVQCEKTGKIFALANNTEKYVSFEDGSFVPKPGYQIVGFNMISVRDFFIYYKKHIVKGMSNYGANVFELDHVKKVTDSLITNFTYLEKTILDKEKEWYELSNSSPEPEKVTIQEWDELLKSTTDIARRIVKQRCGLDVDLSVDENWYHDHREIAIDLLVILTDYFSATEIEKKAECEQKYYALKKNSVIEEEKQNEQNN